jgi:hypothetical protein
MDQPPHMRKSDLDAYTHRPGQVTIQLLDDSSEASACQVEELPAPLHGPTVVRGMLPLAFVLDITVSLLVVEPELNQRLELQGVREQQNHPILGRHDESQERKCG